jgi:hypothetical protein
MEITTKRIYVLYIHIQEALNTGLATVEKGYCQS